MNQLIGKAVEVHSKYKKRSDLANALMPEEWYRSIILATIVKEEPGRKDILAAPRKDFETAPRSEKREPPKAVPPSRPTKKEDSFTKIPATPNTTSNDAKENRSSKREQTNASTTEPNESHTHHRQHSHSGRTSKRESSLTDIPSKPTSDTVTKQPPS